MSLTGLAGQHIDMNTGLTYRTLPDRVVNVVRIVFNSGRICYSYGDLLKL